MSPPLYISSIQTKRRGNNYNFITVLCYFVISSYNEEAKIAYPCALFDRYFTDGRFWTYNNQRHFVSLGMKACDVKSQCFVCSPGNKLTLCP